MARTIRRGMIPTFAALFLATMLLDGGALARTLFDGNWSVSVWTDQGTCDRGYRYEVRVANGAISYRGDEAIDVSGQVNPAGVVAVHVQRGQQFAKGGGRLTKDYGKGTWKGRSSAGECSGWWEAERR